ncbi:MAG TPA: SUMF1/EgtB/PvdO family nonheme iron enzyme, partial [Candidatus Babeliaceae bacterium]|nr:SUMF1/EgtB/PvdO family nonheme iron enzyme [Candidatus Babeliaceae bacterium]
MMKQIYFLLVLVVLFGLGGCGMRGGNDRGEIRPVSQKSFRPEIPYGMVYIPGGSFLMGQTDQDITFAQVAQNKQVTIAPFFMDQTEITNSQYKMFVNWVRDSIAITQYLNDDTYYIHPKGAAAPADGKKYIDWDKVARMPIWGGHKGRPNPN